jgi:hypothetical protein
VVEVTPHKSSFDPAFIADGDRTWLFFSVGRWDRYPQLIKEHQGAVGTRSYHTCYRRTDDSGDSWTESQETPGTFFCRSNGIKLSTGELLLPVYTLHDDGEEDLDRAYRSTDGGKTWALGKGIATPGGTDEPTIAELSDGRVLMIPRTRDGFIWKAYSSDKGKSWSMPVKTDLTAAASSNNLLRLEDGRLALTHNPSPPPFRTFLTIRLSDDDGQTWGTPLQIAEVTQHPVASERQVTYPSVTQLQDGTLVVVWTEIVDLDNQQYGNIWCARIRAPERGSHQ